MNALIKLYNKDMKLEKRYEILERIGEEEEEYDQNTLYMYENLQD